MIIVELLIPLNSRNCSSSSWLYVVCHSKPRFIWWCRKFILGLFRNRFLELHFDDIPQDELEIIIKERCQTAPVFYAKKIVDVSRELIVQRRANRVFETKTSFATSRDLFRCKLNREACTEQLASNGYMLLAERCRTLKKVMSRRLLKGYESRPWTCQLSFIIV